MPPRYWESRCRPCCCAHRIRVPRTPPRVIEAAGRIQCTQGGPFIIPAAAFSAESPTPHLRPNNGMDAIACVSCTRFKRKLQDMANAPPSLKVRRLWHLRWLLFTRSSHRPLWTSSPPAVLLTALGGPQRAHVASHALQVPVTFPSRISIPYYTDSECPPPPRPQPHAARSQSDCLYRACRPSERQSQ